MGFMLLLSFVVRPSAASAAVAFRSASCGQSSNQTTLTLAVPAETVVGDLLVASVGIARPSVNTPAGWTQVPNLRGTVNAEQELVTWYRFATSPIPSSYTFTATGSPDGLAGGILSFSGVWTTTPISGTPAQTIVSSIGTSSPLPNSTGTYAGSMRYSAAAADDLSSASYQNPMTMSCNEPNGTGLDIATSIAWEATGIGTTATRTVSWNDNARSVLQTFVMNPIPCSTGGLNLTAPSGVAFPAVVLNGVDQTSPAVVNLVVDDETGSTSGWNLSGTSTRFKSGTNNLPADATSFTGASATAGTGNCALPTSAVSYPVTLPAAAVAPTAEKLYNAAGTTGRGPVNLDLSVGLRVPSGARVGSYASTWTLTLATGP